MSGPKDSILIVSTNARASAVAIVMKSETKKERKDNSVTINKSSTQANHLLEPKHKQSELGS